MHPQLQRRVQRYGWDRASTFYENSWKEQIAPAQERLLALADLKPGEIVLDTACGTGLVTFEAARAVGASGRVVATDLSDEMVSLTHTGAEAAGLNNVNAKQGDAEELDFEDASFDAALCSLGLMYVPDPMRAIEEMYRVVRPGGRAVVAVWGARSNCGWAGIFEVVDARVNTDVCPMFFHLGTGDILATKFGRAGFVNLVAERIAVQLSYSGQDEACEAAFAGGPVAMAYGRFDDATRESAHAEYLESIEPFRHGTGYRIPGEFVVVRGDRKV